MMNAKRKAMAFEPEIKEPLTASPGKPSEAPALAAEDIELRSGGLSAEPIPSKELKSLRDHYQNHLASHAGIFDFSRVFPNTSNVQELVAQVDDLKLCLDSFRPLNLAQAENLQEAFDTEYTYDSNRIEGNTLTLMETHLVVNKGLTIGGKRMEEHLEAINHKEAIDFIRDMATKNEDLNEYNLKLIQALVLRGIDRLNAGVYRNVPVYISGSTFVPPQPYMISPMMEGYFEYYEKEKEKIHPVLLASEMHERLVTIHPFIDGNGRTSRLVMNLVLLREGFPLTSISSKPEGRENYYNALQTKQTGGSLDDFHRVVLLSVKDAFFRYLGAVAGGIGDSEARKGSHFFNRIKDAL